MSEPEHDAATQSLVDEAMPWIDEHLARQGIARTGPVGEPRLRTWATVIAIPTDHGTTWFKAASDVTAHEIRLYPMLVEAAPGLVLHPFGTDIERAWILLPDGGTSLRRSVSGDALVDRLVSIVPHYALLQRSMASQVPTILELGLPDMRPDVLPERFDDAMAIAEAMARDSGRPGDVDAMRQVRGLRPRYMDWVAELAAGPIQSTMDHSDLHSNNILMPEGPDGAAKIYDWGDSVVAHPFSTLLVLLRSLMDQLEAAPDDPRLHRVRDAYLEPFTDVATGAELVRLADAASWTSVVIRALTWVRVLQLGTPANAEWALAPVEWMKTFLNSSWLD